MADKLRLYKFKEVTLAIGGIRLREFDEDGTIAFAPATEAVEAADGADGTPTYSENASNRMTCTVTVKQTGEAYKYLAALRQAQKLDPTENTYRVPLLFENPRQGDKVVSEWVVILNDPEVSFGRSAGSVEFRLDLPFARRTLLWGTSIN